jgi:hypothetical protein
MLCFKKTNLTTSKRKAPIKVIQLRGQQILLDDEFPAYADAYDFVYLEAEAGDITLGRLGPKHFTAFELRLDPGFRIEMYAIPRPDVEVCNPIDGPQGKRLFRRDHVHSKFFELVFFRGSLLMQRWTGKKAQLIYPAFKSRVTREPCLKTVRHYRERRACG